MVDSAHAHLEQGWPLTKAKMRWAQIAELSLSLSFFLSAGHRGRRDDPQALGPPDHPLFSLSLSLGALIIILVRITWRFRGSCK